MKAKSGIMLYTDTLCPICPVVEKYLLDRNVKYTRINVDKDPEGKKTFLELGYDNLPVLDIEGITILGFNPGAIEKALKERGAAKV